MKVTIYVNWNEHKFFTEDEYKKELEHRAKRYYEDERNFADWLEDHYTATEIYNMRDKQKMAVREAFRKDAIEEEEEDGGFGFYCEEFIFEI